MFINTKIMKYIFYIIPYMLLQLIYCMWHLKFDNYSFKEYIYNIENFEYPIDY